jgi:hypothetical protein
LNRLGLVSNGLVLKEVSNRKGYPVFPGSGSNLDGENGVATKFEKVLAAAGAFQVQ